MKDFKEKIYNLFYKFSFLFSWWYSFCMKITVPSKNKGKIPKYKNTMEIIQALEFGREYKSDPLNGILDIMYHPREVQDRIDKKEKIGDCDDHAIYWATCLIDSGLSDEVWIGTAAYQRKDGTYGGHVVCVFRDLNNHLYWADYNLPYRISSHEEWSQQVGSQKYGVKLIASALVPIKSISKDYCPKFGKSFRI